MTAVAMSRSRKNKAVRSNSVVAYKESMPNRSTIEEVQSENEKSLTLNSLKECITSEFSKVTGDLKTVRLDIQMFGSHLGSVEMRLGVIEKGELQMQKDITALHEVVGWTDRQLKKVQKSLNTLEKDFDQIDGKMFRIKINCWKYI